LFEGANDQAKYKHSQAKAAYANSRLSSIVYFLSFCEAGEHLDLQRGKWLLSTASLDANAADLALL